MKTNNLHLLITDDHGLTMNTAYEVSEMEVEEIDMGGLSQKFSDFADHLEELYDEIAQQEQAEIMHLRDTRRIML